MASSERIIVNPEHLRDGNGTLRRALELWSCRNGPVQYNQWQSVFFALIMEHGMEDEEALPGESQSGRQKRIRGMHQEIQEALHGPDHLAVVLLRKKSRHDPIATADCGRAGPEPRCGSGLA